MYSLVVSQTPAPEVYIVPPPQPKEKKPGQLEKWQLEQFFSRGFLIVPKFFTNEEMSHAVEVSSEFTFLFFLFFLNLFSFIPLFMYLIVYFFTY